MGANNINAFCVDPTEQFVFAGTKLGELQVIAIDKFEVIERKQAHFGSIEAVARHASLPYFATLGNDRLVTVWRFSTEGAVELLHSINVRDTVPDSDKELILPFPSTSQALAFHENGRRIAGHSGNAGLFEIDFDDTGWRVVRCTRPFAEDDLITVRYLPNSDRMLAASVRGEVALVEEGAVLKRWDFGSHNNRQVIHWFEPVGAPGQYLVASDGQQVIRFDVEDREPAVLGPLIARDHLEHVTLNRTSGRAFISSFDRRVQEIDKTTCESLAVIWNAPFKLRWIKTLERSPSTMIVNCRDGALYKIDVDQKRVLARIKETPDCLWTGVINQDSILIYGEGRQVNRYRATAVDRSRRRTLFSAESVPFDAEPTGYVKRAFRDASTGMIALGLTSGEVLLDRGNGPALLCNIGEAVRDLTFDHGSERLFVACEDGTVRSVSISDGQSETLLQADRPIWCLALHPTRNLLAVGQRILSAELLNLDDGTRREFAQGMRFNKRMRWFDDDTLFFGSGGNIWRYKLSDDAHSPFVVRLGNTVEDFDWDENKNFLAVVSYTRQVFLCDPKTGSVLDKTGNGIDYSKGVLFLNNGTDLARYPGDFIVFGRDGYPDHFRVHDDRIVCHGPLATSGPVAQQGRSQ
ncbi:hypothetical protein [Inquilinus sp. Marseille-Q2685]|uniref:WD40 domain-containing protein n=1 Tax=Inquilinus sp. Marseille-Q2685 TaxID=2866581 RepID=UPI001CE44AAB|nr:hypothetical protein [Inquilinus sp. Marseille-Q2685]